MPPRSSSAGLLLILIGTVGFALSGHGASSDDSPAAGSSASENHRHQSVDRLGIKFNPNPQDEKNSPAVPRLAAIDPADASLDVTKLEPFIVKGPRVKITERELLTKKGTLALARKTQLTPLYEVTFGPLSQVGSYYFNWLTILGGWNPNNAEAMTLYRQEEEVRRDKEMSDLMRLESFQEVDLEKSLQKPKPQMAPRSRDWGLAPRGQPRVIIR